MAISPLSGAAAIVGIPLGIACFKMISITLAPFGKEVVKATAVKAAALITQSAFARATASASAG